MRRKEHGSDACYCGDYRSQHTPECGPCKLSPPFLERCKRFRWGRKANAEELAHWNMYHARRPLAKEKEHMKPPKQVAHILFEKHLAELGFKSWLKEHRFHATRKWRLDYLLPCGIGVEIDGGVYTQGRHTRGKGFENDMRKLNAAEMAGIRVLRFSTGMVLRGEAKAFLESWLKTPHNVSNAQERHI